MATCRQRCALGHMWGVQEGTWLIEVCSWVGKAFKRQSFLAKEMKLHPGGCTEEDTLTLNGMKGFELGARCQVK